MSNIELSHEISHHKITQFIKTEAHALGFQKVGIIPAQPLHAQGAHLDSWLEKGYQADMHWMQAHSEKRQNPAQLVENTQSIVCVAINYFPGNPTPNTQNTEAQKTDTPVKIARYAQGTDYHEVVKDKLNTLLKKLQEQWPQIQGRAFTDSAPVMEKPMAEQAGLGWMGKNGNLLTQDYGSWLFLGELFLNTPLMYDVPTNVSHCGTCTRCIDTCPTDAIVQEGVIDANRCIAYWTIEYKGSAFPKPIAENLNGWVFGCDICQEVCPWNIRFEKPTAEESFRARLWNVTPTAEAILALEPETFQTQYRKSPVKRTKLTGLQRNARIVLENRNKDNETERAI
jgi:epoxyqueuosine reductase